MKETIARYCRELKLGGRLIEHYPTIQADSHEEFLAKLLAPEVEHRAVQRKNRLLKQANFDVLKTFAGFEWNGVQIPENLDVEDILKARFIDRKENLILYGAVGTGKTHLATAIGVEACNQGKAVKFYRAAALVNELIEAKNEGNLSRFMNKWRKQIS